MSRGADQGVLDFETEVRGGGGPDDFRQNDEICVVCVVAKPVARRTLNDRAICKGCEEKMYGGSGCGSRGVNSPATRAARTKKKEMMG